MNTLYYGDNPKILREYIKDESVDLIYLDPPFAVLNFPEGRIARALARGKDNEIDERAF